MSGCMDCLLTAPLAPSTKFRVCVFVCVYLRVCVFVYVCMCGCMCAYVHAFVVVCASGFARRLSVDSAAGAVYPINSLICTGP